MGEVREAHGILLVATGLEIEWANIAFVTRPQEQPARAVETAARFFDDRRLNFIVRAREGVDPGMEEALAAAGIPYSDTVPGMFLDDAAACVMPEVLGLRIETVTREPAISDWQRVVAESFGLPPDAVQAFFGLRYFLERGIECYLGYVEGEPVATSTLVASHGVAGVHNVGTLASHRRRSIGEAMTAHVVRRGAEAGCRVSALQVSEMGAPVYERMGFRTIAPYRTFHRGASQHS